MQHEGGLAYGKIVIYDGYLSHFKIGRKISTIELLSNGYLTICLNKYIGMLMQVTDIYFR